jgi:hypothetical protein
LEILFDLGKLNNFSVINRFAEMTKHKKKQKNLSKRKKNYYEFVIGALGVFTGHGAAGITIIPIAIVYFAISGLISLIMSYEPFMMPSLLRLFILGICIVLWFIVSDLINKKAFEMQKRLGEKINFKRKYYDNNIIYSVGCISAILFLMPLSLLCLFAAGVLIFKIFTNF